MGPVTPHSQRLETLRAYYRRQLDRFETLCKETRAEASSKNIHQLRVSCRRLRAVLWLARKSPLEGKGAFKKANAGLQSLGRTLGGLRTWEVAEEDAKTTHQQIEHLKELKQKARRKIEKALTKKDSGKLLRTLGKVERRLWQMTPGELGDAFGKLTDKFTTLKETLPQTAEARHTLRLNLKRVRYVLTALGEPVEELSALQDALGKEHDLNVLAEISGENAALKQQRHLALQSSRKLLTPTLQIVRKTVRKIGESPLTETSPTLVQPKPAS